jgi:ribulose-phosphate 3-epimerase
LAINPATPLSATEEVLADVDQLLVMTVNPGYGGQSFIDSMLGKIGRARKMIDEYAPDVVLEVDGGVKADNAKAAADAGATLLVAGSAVFNHAHSVADSMSALFRAIASE